MAELAPEVIEALLRRERWAVAGRLARGIVHNISGGVQMARLPLELAEIRLGQGQDPSDKLAACMEGLERITQEVGTLATFASEGAKAVDLARLVRDQLGIWRAHTYFKHELQVELDLEEGVGVVASYHELAAAFHALVANAVESLEASGARQLVIRVHATTRAELEVADSGPGISPKLGHKAFEAFVSTKGEDHDGLGLFLASYAVGKWGGQLLWDPSRPSTFTMALPLMASP